MKVASTVRGGGKGTPSNRNHLPYPIVAVEPKGKQFITLGNLKRTALLQNYPNPFNPETWTPYRLAKDVHVVIRIYNPSGHLVRTLDLGLKAAGFYTNRAKATYWDGRNAQGERISSGVYFYHLQAGDYHDTRKMLILK